MKKPKTTLPQRYAKWTLIDWDGNRELKLKCWRKSFGRGHVSIGVGDFQSIIFSYGADSGKSMTSTRWNYDLPPLTEEQAMHEVDTMSGVYSYAVKHAVRASTDYARAYMSKIKATQTAG